MSELSQEDLGHFNDHLTALADEAGLELDDADRMRLFQLSQEGGFNPEATAAAFVDLYGDGEDVDWDEGDEPLTRAEFEAYQAEQQDDEPPSEISAGGRQRLAADTGADAKRLSEKLGRPLLQSEQKRIAERVQEQALRTGQIDVEAAAGGAKSYGDMSRDEINAAMVERTRDLEGRDEIDPERAYDLSNRTDFMDYAKLRLEGAAAEDFDDAPAEGEAA